MAMKIAIATVPTNEKVPSQHGCFERVPYRASLHPAHVQNMSARRPQRSMRNGVTQVPIAKMVLVTAAISPCRNVDRPTCARMMVLK